MDFHYPVMIEEVKWWIWKQITKKQDNGSWEWLIVFDGTLGHWGHLIQLIKYFDKDIELYVATDADNQMLQVAEKRIGKDLQVKEFTSWKIRLYNTSYVHIGEISKELGVKFDVVFLDLGVNLRHFKLAERGFSIKGEWLLDMRYNQGDKKLRDEEAKMGWVTAAQILRDYTEQQLVDMFVINSEISLPASQKIAGEIVRMRSNQPFETSAQLNNLTKRLWYSARVAAIVFQAIRIEVNQEFQNIRNCIDWCYQYMNPDGILIVLSYHSGEDRIVKEIMRKLQSDGRWDILTKHALAPRYQETLQNKPSRSARLRAFTFRTSH